MCQEKISKLYSALFNILKFKSLASSAQEWSQDCCHHSSKVRDLPQSSREHRACLGLDKELWLSPGRALSTRDIWYCRGTSIWNAVLRLRVLLKMGTFLSRIWGFLVSYFMMNNNTCPCSNPPLEQLLRQPPPEMNSPLPLPANSHVGELGLSQLPEQAGCPLPHDKHSVTYQQREA